jgi:predicted nucleic-acid-binding protein
MRAIDTNVLVRLVARDNAKQTAGAETFIASGAWISHIVLVEAVWVLTTVYGLDAQAAATAIDMLLNHRMLSIQDPEAVTAALAIYRTRPQLGFSDCLILEVARRSGHLPVGTFDRRLGRVEGAQEL